MWFNPLQQIKHALIDKNEFNKNGATKLIAIKIEKDQFCD